MTIVLEKEVAELIVDALNLEIDADEIEPEARLFTEGLGLDSIDALELSMLLSKKYGLKIVQGDRENIGIFTSLRTLSNHIAKHRVI